jgi:hypothetical protein
MSWPASPAWLEELQARFGDMLRTPLERSSGSLRAKPDAYPRALLDETLATPNLTSGERLAIYNRQYWFRLFTVLQRAYPLTARLLGYWRFNEHATHFLLARPPRHWSLDEIGAGFADVLAEAAGNGEKLFDDTRPDLEPDALLEAARIDLGYHRVFRAPAVARYEPSAEDAGRLLQARLRLSPAVALLTEHWPLCELRRRAVEAPGEGALRLEPRLARPRHWLLGREGLKLGLVPLEPRELQLLELLARSTVEAALGELEEACRSSGTSQELAELPANIQKWLACSVQRGVWQGADFAP